MMNGIKQIILGEIMLAAVPAGAEPIADFYHG
jgi:hypothetical protein